MSTPDTVNRRVLIVDDQQEIHDDFVDTLKPRRTGAAADELAFAFVAQPDTRFLPDFEILHAMSGEEACSMIEEGNASGERIAVAYVDIRMPPGIDGVETIRRIRKICRDVEVVIMTAYTDRALSEIIRDMELLNKLLYIRKPFAREEVQQITISLVEKWNLEQALEAKRRELVASHERLEAVLDATGDSMAMYDPRGRVVFANAGYEEMLGMREEQLKRLSPRALRARLEHLFEEAPEMPETLRQGRAAKRPGESARLLEAPPAGDGSGRRLFYRFVVPVRDERRDRIGDLVTYRDVSREIEVQKMKVELFRLRSQIGTSSGFGGMVGASAAMRHLYALIRQAAQSDVTVLIRGESGTGKELVARALHTHSRRRTGPFVAINCLAIPETLIESELFGHERGAFTGAGRRKLGAFERARGGTILLDEIGDMPAPLQGKLLRVLQQREFQRVGGTTTIPVDARVVTATNRDLEEAVREGAFREDLFYRLVVFPIETPPLRERTGDIPLLAEHFLRKYAKLARKRVTGISEVVLRLLSRYTWPGNIRELENAIERAVVLETSRTLSPNSLPQPIAETAAPPEEETADPVIHPLAEVEREAIAQAIRHTQGNLTAAAKGLGIHRSTLFRKIKKYELSEES